MKPIKIFQAIKAKKIFYFSLILLLLLGVVAFYGINLFQQSRKAKAALVTCESATGRVDCLIAATVANEVYNVFDWDQRFENSNLTIIGPIEVDFWGHHNLNSLLVTNGATVSHSAIFLNDIANSMVMAPVVTSPGTTQRITQADQWLTPTGQLKRVDLSIAGALTLSVGGKINVNGKGYPGASYTDYLANPGNLFFLYGYGPGGGLSMDGDLNNHWGGAGGSYGGLGGWGNGNSETWCRQGTEPGPTYGSRENPVDPGSGGGFAHTQKYGYWAPGGNGGGVIKIQANSITLDIASGSRISADGKNGIHQSSDLSSGGGSGGSIILQTASDFAQQFSLSVIGGKANPGCADQTGQNGTLWVYNSTQTNATPYYVSAVGGLQGGPEAGNGGGGRIAILKPNQYGIEKTLTKISPTDSSSPYALKSGDVIQVNLHVTNLIVGPPVTIPVAINDEYFNDGLGSKLIAVNMPSWSPGCTESGDTNSVNCNFVPTGRTADLHYQLRVP